jgi:DNA-binding FadR family transcriptional regulator
MDAAFHVGIAEMAGNEIVRELLNFIYEKIYLRYRTERIPFKRMDEADKEHTLLLHSIKKKNLSLSRKVLEDHFIKVKKNLLMTIRAEM